MNLYAAISLVTLVVVILLGFFRKVNVGLLAILAAALLGSALGLSDSTIINGFSASLFINLLGVSFLCSAAISNGALETVSKKFLRLAGLPRGRDRADTMPRAGTQPGPMAATAKPMM